MLVQITAVAKILKVMYKYWMFIFYALGTGREGWKL